MQQFLLASALLVYVTSLLILRDCQEGLLSVPFFQPAGTFCERRLREVNLNDPDVGGFFQDRYLAGAGPNCFGAERSFRLPVCDPSGMEPCGPARLLVATIHRRGYKPAS